MNTLEIGLSLYQPIRETCFSGYAKVREGRERLLVGVDVTENFEGDATLEIVLFSDADDCMMGASELYRTQPLTKNDLEGGSSFGFALNGLGEPYICIQYVVRSGIFTKGQMTARISDEKNPWFVGQEDLVEVSGTPWDEPKADRKSP